MTFNDQILTTAELLRGAARPLFVWGAGMRPHASAALALARSFGVPVACTWGAIDLINHNDPLAVGGFGTHGTRAANLAVQNADLLVCIGCRLDTKATGTPADFAPKAQIVMVDIDAAEIAKFGQLGRRIDVGICADAGVFLDALRERCDPPGLNLHWLWQIKTWREEYVPQGQAYSLMTEIGRYTDENDIIVSDTGNTLGWIMQGFPFKGERFIHAFNFTPMGYGIAGAIGAAFADPLRRVVCIVGDGGALMSINELATIARHELNIKIILLNNMGHSMCRHTQRQWLGGKYYATSIQGGLGMPASWPDVAMAFGLNNYSNLPISESFKFEGPQFYEVMIDPDESLAFQVKYGEALA